MFAHTPFADAPIADLSISNIVGFADGFADVSANLKFVLYAATQQFASEPNDSIVPSQPFSGTLEVPLAFKWSIIGNDLGTFATGDGTCVLNNSDGAYDNLPSTFTADGRPIIVKAFRRGDDYATALVLFKGVMASWFIDETQVIISIRDYGYKLTVPAQPNLYGGTGGIDGGSDLAQKRKPLVFGHVLGWAATLLDPAYLTYQLHDGPINAVSAVYDSGAALNFAADYPNYSSLVAAAIPAGQYGTCRALGMVRLSSNPLGQVTCDLEGDKTGGSFAGTTGAIVRRWLTRAAAINDPDDLFTPSFDDLEAEQPAPVGYGVTPDDSHSIADVIADMMHGIGGWGGFRKNGTFEVKRLLAPDSDAVAYYTAVDIIELKREQLPAQLLPPPYRQRVTYQRNWCVLSSFAGVVSADRKAYLGSNYNLAEASDQIIKTDHPFAQDPEPRACYFRDRTDADTEAARMLDLYRVERAFYRLTLPRRALTLELGDTINVSYRRWDLTAGRNMRVLEISANLQRPRSGAVDTVEVVAYG